ncbi:MAG: hypothetical protein LBH84_07095, partial [Prevotellaceae bacterium]|nr:hypothetical protein [Prevotellaceae bacterium]
MTRKLTLSALFFPLLLSVSCYEEASIQVTNSVHNVRMDNIQFDKIGIGSMLMPGESTKKLTISEYTEDVTFPISAQLQFYMVADENVVFLKTKKIYTLHA